METTGFFIIHEGSPHLLLDSFPRDLLSIKTDSDQAQTDEITAHPLAFEGSCTIETQDGSFVKDGYIFPLNSHLGLNGKKLAHKLSEDLKNKTLSEGSFKIRLGEDGSLIGWSQIHL